MKNEKGLFVGLGEDKQPVYIAQKQLAAGRTPPHIQICATTGAGKGVFLALMASQFLQRGESCFFIDPKNDEWAPSVLHATAKRLNVPYHYIDLNKPNGFQFNILEGATEEQIFELFQAGLGLIDKGDASDFYGIDDRRHAQLTAKLIAEKKYTIAEAFNESESALFDKETGAKKFGGKLRELAETPSINAKSGGVSFPDIVANGGCVYIVGSSRNDIIKTIQKVILVRIAQLAESRDRMAGPVRKIALIVDECKYSLSNIFLQLLGLARDKSLHLLLAHQSLGDLKDCTKDMNPDAVVDAIVENCSIKLCYRVQSPDTAEWLAQLSGEILVDDESRNVKKNVLQAETVDGMRSIRQAERYFIDKNMLQNLPDQVAVLYGQGLPKFVSIQPIKADKSPEAIKINIASGIAVKSELEAITATPEEDNNNSFGQTSDKNNLWEN